MYTALPRVLTYSPTAGNPYTITDYYFEGCVWILRVTLKGSTKTHMQMLNAKSRISCFFHLFIYDIMIVNVPWRNPYDNWTSSKGCHDFIQMMNPVYPVGLFLHWFKKDEFRGSCSLLKKNVKAWFHSSDKKIIIRGRGGACFLNTKTDYPLEPLTCVSNRHLVTLLQ